jgi:hypothetical protein
MSVPSVNWGQRPSKKTAAQQTDALDSFVNLSKDKATKRLNLNIPARLHARIKAQCAMEGRDMTQALIELLESRFSENPLK